MATPPSIFLADGERFMPTEHARGPWDSRALHGGSVAALITSAFERLQPDAQLPIARLVFEFLRPIPCAPLTLSTRVVRSGRRVQELTAELRDAEQLVARASALCVQKVPADVAGAARGVRRGRAQPAQALAPPDAGKLVQFALNDSSDASFAATGMEMRWLDDPQVLGPRRVWMRMRHPLLPGEPLTSLARLAGAADFGNGVGAALPFADFLFINADLTIHLQRPPSGEWIGLDARTLLQDGGTGLAESVLYDQRGVLGCTFQTLVVQAR